MKKTKIAFLFGAGAERNFGLPTGNEYLKDTFFCKKTDVINSDLCEYFSEEYFDKSYKLGKEKISQSYGIILKNLAHYLIDLKSLSLNKSLIEKWNKETDVVIEFNSFLNAFISCEKAEDFSFDFRDENLVKIKDAIFSKNNETDNEKENVKQKKEIKFSEIYEALNSGIAGILDKYFHTIINPHKYGPKNFAKIFKYYWSCYFSIVDKIVLNNRDYFRDYIQDEQINYKKIIAEISTFTKKLYDLKFDFSNSYYSLINEKIQNYDCNGVITTNYYKFAEEVFKNSPIAYPNGKLNLFEFPETLDVKNAGKERLDYVKNNIFFPFVFGQSHIKPIVHNLQIQEFQTVAKILGISDENFNGPEYLVILGYGINDDDNHLNSFLHEYVLKGGVILFVTDKKNCREEICNKLRLTNTYFEQVMPVLVSYKEDNNSTIVEKIFDEIN